MNIIRKTTTHLLIACALALGACSKQDNTQGMLGRAEEALTQDPAQALAILDSIDSQHLASDEEEARYALFLTMAHGINDDPLDNDSLINVAVSYFRKHGPRELLIKALIAKANIHLDRREFGKTVLAATEATDLARQDSAYLYMAKGEELLTHTFRLTQKFDDCLKHSRRAAEYYKQAGRTINHWFCLTDIVDAYTMNPTTYGQAEALLDSIESVATDSGVLSDCKAQRMYLYLDKSEYKKAEQCMRQLMSLRHDYQSGPVEHTWIARIKHARGDVEGAKREIDTAWAMVRDAVDKTYITNAVYRMVKEDGNYQRACVYADSLMRYQAEATSESFRQSVVTAQRDYYNSEAKKEGTAKARMQRLAVIVIIICLVILVAVASVHQFRIHVKDNLIESKMNEILVLSERVQKDDQENQDLKLLAEKSMRDRWETVNMLCNEYFEKGDNERLKATIINKVDKEMERICSKKHMEEIEQLVNKSLNGIVDKLRAQCPELKQEDVLFATLVYAGLAPRAVCLCTNIKLKYYYTKRMRLVERINKSSASDKELFISKLWRHTDKDATSEAEGTEAEKE